MPEPEKADPSSQPIAIGMQQPLYKSLLNQQAQKLYKQLPVYDTKNEGSDHQPKFRTTVSVDGESYTSPNTFQSRKLAEADASKIAFLAITQKLKNEALNHIHEDKTFSKSILMEYGVRMNVQRPIYQTVQMGSVIPVFRSSLVFNGVTYTGDDCRTKKEAEQSVARAVILKHLDSESGNMLSEIIKSKFNLIKNNQNIEDDNNGEKGDEMTKTPLTSLPLPESLDITTPRNVQEISTTQINTPVMVMPVTQIPQIVTQAVTQIPLSETTIAASLPSSNVVQPIKSEALIAPPLPACNVVQPINSVAPSVTITSPEISGRKRRNKNRKNAQKRMRAENQLAIAGVFQGQVPTQ